jgi:thiol-disulfide isomerase/thioredoxin
MQHVEPYSSPTRIPHLPEDAIWLNDAPAAGLTALQDRTLLFDFWDYTCINCLRTLPYLREWHRRYQHFEFTMIAIHTPEFPFAEDPENVRRAVQRLGVSWPVVLDNDQSIWTSFANRYWPTKYLADHNGYLRYRHAGEGDYGKIEAAIQDLLLEAAPGLELPEIMQPVRPDDKPGAVCERTTPELQAGSLGNPETGPALDVVLSYSLPDMLEPGKFYLEGGWETVPHGHRLHGEIGRIELVYEAARCNAVLNADQQHQTPEKPLEPILIELIQDDVPLSSEYFGQDVFQDQQRAFVRVDSPRLYSLIELPAVEGHRLSLEISTPGLTFYSFSFESCASVQKSPQSKTEV